jgi:hypothetical protein
VGSLLLLKILSYCYCYCHRCNHFVTVTEIIIGIMVVTTVIIVIVLLKEDHNRGTGLRCDVMRCVGVDNPLKRFLIK